MLQYQLQSIHKIASAFEKTSTRKSVNKIKRFTSQGLDVDSSIKESRSYYFNELEKQTILAKSIFILAFSYLEHYVNNLCEIYKNNFDGITLKLNEINGKGITRAKIYLEKVANASPLMTNEEWEKFSILNEIRNKIVHSGSLSDEELGKKINKLSKNNLISINMFGEIEFQTEFDESFHCPRLHVGKSYENGLKVDYVTILYRDDQPVLQVGAYVNPSEEFDFTSWSCLWKGWLVSGFGNSIVFIHPESHATHLFDFHLIQKEENH
jgi:hypothetical protein